VSVGARITRGLGQLATRAPALAFRAADLIAAMAWPGVSRERIETVFPHLSRGDVKRVSAHARNAELRNELVMEMMLAGGMDPVRALVDENEQLAALRPPLILGTFHVGALTAIGAGLERVPGRVLVLRRSSPLGKVPSPLRIEETDGDEQRRALVFHRALDWLRGGDSVFMPLDPEQAAVRLAVPFEGRTLHLARGPFAVARIARVPIVPIVARWRGTRAEIVVGDAIAASSDESAMASSAAAWLERYLRESPLEISARILALTT
jgi:hypothetical protein